MDLATRDTPRLYEAVRDLDVKTILELLQNQEISRSATTERATFLLEAQNMGSIRLEEWETGYLVKVENENEKGLELYWDIDLAWRRYVSSRTF